MTALAEGIETKDEWEWLVDRGCALGQGYYFSRPIPAAEILALHRRASLTVVEGSRGRLTERPGVSGASAGGAPSAARDSNR